ncbi:MAG: 30S ribosomal protein S14 [Bacteroides sp.]|nr:MAG: 30S ribosomal protein S14 [Bacteroides sp.]
MAKESVKARNIKRINLVEKYSKLRLKLKKMGNYKALDKLPRNSSPVRLRNRCSITGRSRGYMRSFGISRIVFRNMALKGQIAGIVKASW